MICVFWTLFPTLQIEFRNLEAEIQNKLLTDKQRFKKIESANAFLEDPLEFVSLIHKRAFSANSYFFVGGCLLT